MLIKCICTSCNNYLLSYANILNKRLLFVEELGDSTASLVKWSSMELIGDDTDLDSASPSAVNEKQGKKMLIPKL
jgi:hypothetical protein